MLLAKAILMRNRRYDALANGFEGANTLRGIEGCDRYPITAIKFHDGTFFDEETPYANWLTRDGETRIMSPEKVVEICDYFFRERRSRLRWLLFLRNSPEFGRLSPRAVDDFLRMAKSRSTTTVASPAEDEQSRLQDACSRWLGFAALSKKEKRRIIAESDNYLFADPQVKVVSGGDSGE